MDVPRGPLGLAPALLVLLVAGCPDNDPPSGGPCEEGVWTETTGCWEAEGRLCEANECVDPWRYGDPDWSTCLDEPLATAESLGDKAAYYDDIAPRLHVHPELRWASSVFLQRQEVECPPDLPPPCYEPLVPADEATEGTWRPGSPANRTGCGSPACPGCSPAS